MIRTIFQAFKYLMKILHSALTGFDSIVMSSCFGVRAYDTTLYISKFGLIWLFWVSIFKRNMVKSKKIAMTGASKICKADFLIMCMDCFGS
jgi:hypothetical protein